MIKNVVRSKNNVAYLYRKQMEDSMLDMTMIVIDVVISVSVIQLRSVIRQCGFSTFFTPIVRFSERIPESAFQ